MDLFFSSKEKADNYNFIKDAEALFFENTKDANGYSPLGFSFRVTGKYASKTGSGKIYGTIQDMSVYLHRNIEGDNYDNDIKLINNITSQGNLV